MQNYLLSSLIFLPLIVVLGILLIPPNQKTIFKIITLSATFLQLLLAFWIYFLFDKKLTNTGNIFSEKVFQMVEKAEWIRLDLGNLGVLSIQYFLGVDGLSMTMVLLSGIVLFIGAISSLSIDTNEKGYFALYLLLSSTIMGCFIALDFFLFYLFFEFMLLPMYFLIGIWGGERREYASIKFFIYTLIGSILILIVMIALYLSVKDPDSQTRTFNILAMMNQENYVPTSFLSTKNLNFIGGWEVRHLAFLALFFGFAIKLPVVPFHTWLPDAHVEAPTPISVILAGLLLKIGAFGIIRFAYGIFPEAAMEFAWLVAFMGTLSIIYGALNALAMTDLKKMIAYSSVSHMGFVLLGIASLTVEGLNGAIFQLFSHGILSAMLFLLAGVLYDRSQDLNIANYRGLMNHTPYFGSFVMIGFFASLGLPGFSGFIGELFTLLGAFQSPFIPNWMAATAAFGIVLGAAYFLWTLQRMFFGKLWLRSGKENLPKFTDLSQREWLLLFPLALISLLLGILPGLLFGICSQTVSLFLGLFKN